MSEYIEKLANIIQANRFISLTPMVHLLSLPANQLISRNTETIIGFSETYNSGFSTSPVWDDVNKYLIVNEPGWYLILTSTFWEADNKGIRSIKIYWDTDGTGFNNVIERSDKPKTRLLPFVLIMVFWYYFVPGSKVQFRVLHKSRNSLNLLAGKTQTMIYKLS